MVMMGTKARIFAPIAVVSLEDLVPSNHFYRHLDHVLDLSFVRDLVKETYAHGGRPSIDPVVFFKLQLVMFLKTFARSGCSCSWWQINGSRRWYVGYNLDEPLPDHSSLTRIRERYGVEVFGRFFEAIVEQCQAAGLVWGKELYFDGTKVEANASLDSVKPRFAVDAHVATLFGTQAEEAGNETDQDRSQEEAASSGQGSPKVPKPLPTSLSQEEQEALAQHNEERHDWTLQLGAQDRSVAGR
jgi:transposase